ncbi:S-adenosyl-L-methionine-dependent methyltransferase [Phialemonium atrogriseum]|uniref:S-adenosyl-L-methionine-dependent methyltransferase n=1 Tax=Phialemonium atrogriseum TaxID=1093897 RepID=A0AAJ0C797_9PEZI|nr:S-adenosyl-L-methionine-dependent methyltransferase [Phialemonium atrogriseum]KAK1770822.1 S-adenosyl-L-methionine-dependent methyltransferase [Phialemonium atrogriseum]
MWVSLFSDRYLGSPEGGGDGGDGEGEETGGGGEAGEPGYVAVRRRRGPAGSGAVTRVLGVEPSADMHEPLREKVREAGLEGVYEVVPVGIEDLAPSGRVLPESVDCIVSILCLCGIPDPERNIRELYGCLKPGGRWYVYEHVRCVPSQGWAMGVYQAFVNLFWPPLIGGCQLRRDTRKSLREAGPWTHVDLEVAADEPWFSICPHILGVLTK